MIIGIDASRAFLKERTGVEEYSYQVVKCLRGKLENHQAGLASTRGDIRESRRVVLYLRKNQTVDFPLPKNWQVKTINFPYFWTQLGLSLEMLLHPIDALFIPAHTVPVIHPKKTIVTVHGLEYEVMPQAYSFLARMYMRLSIKSSCRWASLIIAVSENTKKDLMKFYKVSKNKVTVVHEGVADKLQTTNHESQALLTGSQINSKSLLFIGRLEERKNIIGIVRAFEILKDRYKIPHKLVLAGRFGYGEKRICQEMKVGKYGEEIVCAGYVSEEEKWSLLQSADIFLFPTFYEGFGLPVLEAQSVGVPVVTSNVSSLPEVGADSVAYCDPHEPVSIADAAYSLIGDSERKNDIIEKGLENVKRFSWDKCAEEIVAMILL
jgi:glycosyltransferase involved in cell wall biosynthesis